MLPFCLFFMNSCSEKQRSEEKGVQTENYKTITYVYNGNEYAIKIDEKRNLIPTEESECLQNLLSQQSDATSFSFGFNPEKKVFIFNSEMDGYKYIEENKDKELGRKFQVAHATNLLRDELIKKYGTPDIDYTNPQIYTEALAGIEEIYRVFKIAGDIPRDLEFFMGKLERNDPNQGNSRSNGLFRLWEHANLQGEMFDMESEPNVWSWTHGNWNCYKTYQAADLNWNYRQNNQSWNDCMSSACLARQQGADAVAFGFFRHPHFTSYGCDAHITYYTLADWQQYGNVDCINNLYYQDYVNLFCGNMENNLSSLKMKIVWQGCPLDFSDM